MLYDVTLRIRYGYQTPAAGVRQLLRLQPRDGPGQRVIVSALDVTPRPDERSERSDFFGNRVTEVAFLRPITEVDFTLRARIERLDQPEWLDASSPPERLAGEIAAMARIDRGSPQHYLHASPRVAASQQVTDFAREAAQGAVSSADLVRRIALALKEEMTFDSNATHVDTPLDEAFAQRRGVCQDYSHIMIAALRSLGVPAGYVSGFLRTDPPPGRPRLAGADAMHAWVRAWCGMGMGWLDIDPTNGVLAGADHITVGHGRDYSDVAPVRGAIRLAGGHDSGHAVDVIPAA